MMPVQVAQLQECATQHLSAPVWEEHLRVAVQVALEFAAFLVEAAGRVPP